MQALSGVLTGDYELIYDAENRLVKVKKDTTTIAGFVYDADGRLTSRDTWSGDYNRPLFLSG